MATDVALEDMTIDDVADWLVKKGFDDGVVDAVSFKLSNPKYTSICSM